MNNSKKRIQALKEIERKFLIVTLPDHLDQYSRNEIVQGYLAMSEDRMEVRLRNKGGRYYQTIKNGRGKIRLEREIEITEEQFEELWGATKGKRVEKTRYEIPNDDVTIELDVYHGGLDGLLIAEVEFSTEQQSEDFVPPAWFGKEVTDDASYTNQSLAKNGRSE